MQNKHALAVIIAEEIAIIILGLCLAGLVLTQIARLGSTNVLVTATPQPTLLALATPPPTATPTPTATSTHTPTLTPVPWKTLTQCGSLNQPGEYHLGADLTAQGDCLQIQTSNLVLDCLGYALRGTDYKGYGIVVRKPLPFGAVVNTQIELRNCRISNFFDGIYVESGKQLFIHDNESSDNHDDAERGSRYGKFLGTAEGSGIRLNYVSDSQVLNNRTLTQSIGIDVRFSANVLVRGNLASNNSAWGISLQQTQNSEVSNNTASDNVRQCTWGEGTVGYGCDAGGIMVQDGSNGNVVANNIVIGRNGNGVFIKAHAVPCGNHNSISGNTIVGALYNSVELGFCTGNQVNGNVMRDGLDGVYLVFANGNEIKDNTITNMRNHGIISANSYYSTVSGNQITHSNEAIYFFSTDYNRTFFNWLPPGDYRSHDNCLCGNRIESNAVAIHLKDATANRLTNNTFQNNTRSIWIEGRNQDNDTAGNIGGP